MEDGKVKPVEKQATVKWKQKDEDGQKVKDK